MKEETQLSLNNDEEVEKERVSFIYTRLNTQEQHIDRISKFQLILFMIIIIDVGLTFVLAYFVLL